MSFTLDELKNMKEESEKRLEIKKKDREAGWFTPFDVEWEQDQLNTINKKIKQLEGK